MNISKERNEYMWSMFMFDYVWRGVLWPLIVGAWRIFTETGLGGGGGGAADFLLDFGEIDSLERIPEESCSIDLITSSLERERENEKILRA